MNTELQQRAAHIESLQHAMQDLKCQIDQKDDKIKDFKREAEDLQTR
jgi:peptidoglycan hydrolase CwlO-like protein